MIRAEGCETPAGKAASLRPHRRATPRGTASARGKQASWSESQLLLEIIERIFIYTGRFSITYV